MSILDHFTAEQIEELKQALTTATSGRSPFRTSRYADPRQLDDLTLKPTKDDPRPAFFPSAEPPRNAPPSRPKPFPKLMFHKDTGVEVKVLDAQHEARLGDDYGSTPPMAVVLTAAQKAQALFDALSEDDRQFVLEATRKQRLEQTQLVLAALTEKDLATVTGKTDPKKPRKSA